MTTLNNVVLFVLVLFVLSVGSVVPADAQTRAERNAYASMDRAVQSAQANPTADRIAAAQRAIRSAYNVFLRQEQQRDAPLREYLSEFGSGTSVGGRHDITRGEHQPQTRAAMRYVQLFGMSPSAIRRHNRAIGRALERDGGFTMNRNGTAMEECTHPSSLCREIISSFQAYGSLMRQAINTHGRYLHAAMDEIRDAADAIARLDPSILGTRHNDLLLRFGNANMATLRQLGVVLQARSGNWDNWDESAFDTALSTLVDSASDVADAMANRQREDVSNQQAFIEAERRQEQERQQAQIQEQQRQQERAEQLRTGTVTTRQEFDDALSAAMWEARQAARAVLDSDYYEDAHPHHTRGNAAVSRARSLIAGNAGYTPTEDYSQYHQILSQFSRDLSECPNKPRRQR